MGLIAWLATPELRAVVDAQQIARGAIPLDNDRDENDPDGRPPLLHFGVTGDTRPRGLNDVAGYPTAIIDSIADRFQASSVQFVVDTGNHSFASSLPSALSQMSLYIQATKRFDNPWYLSEGNYDCLNNSIAMCLPGSQAPSFLAFRQALAPVSLLPYYSFHVRTPHGRATFVVIAGNSWDATQAAWLEETLATADRKAKYTVVISNHPLDDAGFPQAGAISTIVRHHKFALFISDSQAMYRHLSTDTGRDFILGLGGAPLNAAQSFYGYAIVDQVSSGLLQVGILDLSTGNIVDIWTAWPNDDDSH
jgi:hypothetical protein